MILLELAAAARYGKWYGHLLVHTVEEHERAQAESVSMTESFWQQAASLGLWLRNLGVAGEVSPHGSDPVCPAR